MTTGALIFAFNNELTDYVRMASWSADRIKKHLGIPVAVVTDCTDQFKLTNFDQVIHADPSSGGTRYFDDYRDTITWYNAGRIDAYNLSPWDQTLVLDADYVVCSNMLRSVINSKQDFMCHRLAWDVTNTTTFDGLNHIGNYHMPMWWATVMMFRKINTEQCIFDCMSMIKENWKHYKDLYHIISSNYRNDYALSIAIGIESGHTLQINNIPWDLPSVLPQHQLTQISQDQFQIQFLDVDNKPKFITWQDMDFHAMGKKYLGDIVANPC